MWIAVCAGPVSDIDLLLDWCAARLLDRQSERVDALLVLGDLPLIHDFSAISRGASRRQSPTPVADFVHGRRSPRLPLLCLGGERDDAGLLATLGRRSPFGAWDKTQEAPQVALDPRLYYLPSGAFCPLRSERNTAAIGALSGFGPGAAIRDTVRRSEASSRREAARRLMRAAPGSLDLLCSHDTPELAMAGGAAAEHPGAIFLEAIDRLQPRLAIHAHAQDGFRRWERGRCLVHSLPTPRPGDAAAALLVETESGETRN